MIHGHASTDRAVEVIFGFLDGGVRHWEVGSGYLIEGRYAITAAHNIKYRSSVGEGEVLEVRAHWLEPEVREYQAEIVVAGSPDIDLAIVRISDKNFAVTSKPVRWARIDRAAAEVIRDCWAVGFPVFKEFSSSEEPYGKRIRDTHQVMGDIAPGSNRTSRFLELITASAPEPSPKGTPWSGMLGALMFAPAGGGEYVAVGVLVEHRPPEGLSSLVVYPVDLLPALGTKFLGSATPESWTSLPQRSAETKLVHTPTDSLARTIAGSVSMKPQHTFKGNLLTAAMDMDFSPDSRLLAYTAGGSSQFGTPSPKRSVTTFRPTPVWSKSGSGRAATAWR